MRSPWLDRRALLLMVCHPRPRKLVRSAVTSFGLPLGSVLALAAIVVLPLAAYGLYRIDRTRGDGHVTVFGFRAPTDASE